MLRAPRSPASISSACPPWSRWGAIGTRAATGQLVWELDDVQYSLREGPCVDSITRERVVIVEQANDRYNGQPG
jgi:hypothetical protein